MISLRWVGVFLIRSKQLFSDLLSQTVDDLDVYMYVLHDYQIWTCPPYLNVFKYNNIESSDLKKCSTNLKDQDLHDSEY